MEPSELLARVARHLEALDIEYFTTGSMASIIYGEPRFTNDVDVVIRIAPGDVPRLAAMFPDDEFYLSAEAAAKAAAAFVQFNVIHPASGLKIDFMVAEPSEFNRSRFARARSIEIAPGIRVRFASPEDVILRKLESFREGGSDKHLRDIRGILRLCDQPVDRAYIARWASRLGVEDEWTRALQESGGSSAS
jgi:hypothetical protein